jgi:hypothetical protein
MKLNKKVSAVQPKLSLAVFCVSGHRGSAYRLGQFYTDEKGVLHVRAVQERDAKTGVFKPLKNGAFCDVTAGCITGDAAAKLQLGAYMNGGAKCNTAKIRQVSQKELAALPKARVKFTMQDTGYECRYLGDPNAKTVKGIVVVINKIAYYWQAEQDRNVHNKHERTVFEPLKAGQKMIASK